MDMTPYTPAAFSHLEPEEAEFVYNVEVLGLPVRKAASLAGMRVMLVVKQYVAEMYDEHVAALESAIPDPD